VGGRPGNYLLRAEIIALHSASKQGEAQFYV
jgi:cellulase